MKLTNVLRSAGDFMGEYLFLLKRSVGKLLFLFRETFPVVYIIIVCHFYDQRGNQYGRPNKKEEAQQ